MFWSRWGGMRFVNSIFLSRFGEMSALFSFLFSLSFVQRDIIGNLFVIQYLLLAICLNFVICYLEFKYHMFMVFCFYTRDAIFSP